MRFLANSESGTSMISVIMAMGLMGVLFMVLNAFTVNAMKAQNHIKDKNDRESIRNTLETQTSCVQTLPSACTPGDIVDLRKTDGSVLVSSTSGKTYGKYVVRAECSSTGIGVTLRIAKMNNPSLTSTDPDDFIGSALTGEIYTWEDDETLLRPKHTELCGVPAERDMKCYDGIRQNNTLVKGSWDIFQFTGSSVYSWGIACKKPYHRTGCAIDSVPDTSSDRDVRYTDYGCSSDNEEWYENAKLHISCCRIDY